MHQLLGTHIYMPYSIGDDELCFMKGEGPYMCTKMPFSQSCIHQLAQIAIHNDGISPIWYGYHHQLSYERKTISPAALLWLSIWYSLLSSWEYVHPNQMVFWTLAKVPEPIRSPRVSGSASISNLRNFETRRCWINDCTFVTYIQIVHFLSLACLTWTSSGTGTAVVSSSEGKSDPSKKLQDPEIGKCS